MRSDGGAEARLCSAVQIASLTSGVTAIFSLARRAQHPIECEGEFSRFIDILERLQRQVTIECQVERGTVHGQYRRSRGAPFVEYDDLSADKAAKLQSERSEQYRLARAGWSDDQGMAHIVDEQVQPERRRTSRLRQHQRRSAQVMVGFRPGPDGRHGHQMDEVQGVDDRLADIGVGVAGRLPSQASTAFRLSRMVVIPRPLMMRSRPSSFSSARAASSSATMSEVVT